MIKNSKNQTLDIIKANPGLSGAEIGNRCWPRIGVNTTEKNISHIRDMYGDDCIETIMVTVKMSDGSEKRIANYYWRGIKDEKKSRKEKHKQEYEELCERYLNNPEERINICERIMKELDVKHLQRLRIREQIEKLRSKQADSGARIEDNGASGK